MAFVKRSIVGTTAVITLGNGQTISADYNDLSDDMKVQAAVFGLKHKIGDGSSGFSRAKDYAGAYAECMAIRDSIIIDNVWNRKGGGAGARDIVEAVIRVTLEEQGITLTVEQVEASIESMDEDTYDGLTKDSRIKAAIKAIQAERAATAAETAKPTLDLGSLFPTK